MTSIAVHNKGVYETERAVKVYAERFPFVLTPAEAYCVGRIPDDARGSILDVGIGAGRTTWDLTRLFESYVGIDYSEKFISAAKLRYSDQDLRVADARSLPFETQFDCVFFSFNGIDYVELDDRTRILSEFSRVLLPGGYLIYSTHNLHHSRVKSWLRSFWVKELFVPIHRLRFIFNRWRNFQRQHCDNAAGIAYVNDPGLGFSLINAYLDIPREIIRLKGHGLDVEMTMGCTKASATYDSADCWVYLMARKRRPRLSQ